MYDPIAVLKRAQPVLIEAELCSLDHARACAELFSEVGVGGVEVSLNHPDAWKMVKIFRIALRGAVVGVGGVGGREQMLRAADEAEFACSPTFSAELTNMSRKTLLAYIPSITSTPELEAVTKAGLSVVKFRVGQRESLIPQLREWSDRFPRLHLCPSLGGDGEDYRDCLSLANVSSVAGSWLVPAPAQINADRDACLARLRRVFAGQ